MCVRRQGLADDKDQRQQEAGHGDTGDDSGVRTALAANITYLAADQHDHEQEEHHDSARIDNDLHEAQELRAQHDVHGGKCREIEQQIKRAMYGVAA